MSGKISKQYKSNYKPKKAYPGMQNRNVELMAVETRPARSQNAVRSTPMVVATRSPGGQVTSEDGYFDSERSATALIDCNTGWAGAEMDPNTTAMLCLFAPTQGDDISNRRARRAYVKKIRISGLITIPPGSTTGVPTAGIQVRMIAYCDKQTNGAQVSPATLLQSGNNTDGLHMFQSTAGFGRFKVFKDKTLSFSLDPVSIGGANSVGYMGQRREFTIAFKPNMWVNYNATNGGTVADIIDNSFHFAIGTSTAGVTAGVTVQYKVRTVFTP